MAASPKALSHALNVLASGGITTIRTKDADEVMLATGGTIICRGVLCNIVWRKLSPGTGTLSTERTN